MFNITVISGYFNFNIKFTVNHGSQCWDTIISFTTVLQDKILKHVLVCLTNKSRNTEIFEIKIMKNRKRDRRRKERQVEACRCVCRIIGEEPYGILLRRYLWTNGAQFPILSINSQWSWRDNFEIIRRF